MKKDKPGTSLIKRLEQEYNKYVVVDDLTPEEVLLEMHQAGTAEWATLTGNTLNVNSMSGGLINTLIPLLTSMEEDKTNSNAARTMAKAWLNVFESELYYRKPIALPKDF